MNICGDCAHWHEEETPEPDAGVCYGGPPSAVFAPVKSKLQLAGPSMMAMRAIRAATKQDERACGAFEPKPVNGEPQ